MADRAIDRRRLLRALLLAAGGLAVPAACGVPAGGGPIVDGNGPPYDPVLGGAPPPDPDEAATPRFLVEGFLEAASGPLAEPDQFEKARQRALSFLTPEARDSWKGSNSPVVTVVRVDDLISSVNGSNKVVSGTLQTVGAFARDRGVVDPPPAGITAPVPVRFTVTQTAAGLRISELPPLPNGLPLSAAALDNKYFTAQVIYFWDNNRPFLVPDLRYVPNTGLVANQRFITMVKWLLDGPSPLINSVASTIFPPGIEVQGPNADVQRDKVVLNFSAALQSLKDPDLAKLLAQLQWSLQSPHRLAPGWVELQIASRPQKVTVDADQYRKVNPADDRRTADPQVFYVLDKVVRAVDGALPAVLARTDQNRDVAKAALNRDGTGAALVTTQGRLLVGRADDRDTVSYQPVPLQGRVWSRPVWLPSGRKLLVAVDGTLYAVNAGGAVLGSLASGVTAFAVAPDGYRIAIVQAGVLQVVALHDDADQQSVGNSPRTLDTGLTDLTAVAWSRLDRLVVAGRDRANQWRLAELTIDGAVRVVWETLFGNRIVSIVAYPKPPSQTPGPGAVMVQTEDNTAFRVFASSSPAQPEQLTAPEPSPSTTTKGAKPVPTAPFYPD